MLETNPKPVRVYLVHWNQPGWLADSVANLLHGGQLVQITVINNGPQPEAEIARLLPDQVNVVASGANLGYAGGANVALKQWLSTGAEFAIVGAHDLQIEPFGLDRLIELAHANPTYGVIGAMLKGKVVGCNSIEAIAGRGEPLVPTDWVSGTGMLIRRSCIEDIGGFDRVYESYSEDVDLCRRAIRGGWQVGLASKITMWGRGSGDAGARSTSLLNGVRADWTDKRFINGIRRLAKLTAQLFYHNVRGRVPIGPAEQRSLSADIGSNLVKVFKRLPVLWRTPDTTL